MKHGFTLIEVMLAIVIMGLLIVLAGASWAAASARSRDNSRKADLARMKNGLQQYFGDFRTYPLFDNQGSQQLRAYSADWQLSTNACHPNERLTPRYITAVPRDPKQADDLSQLTCSDAKLTQNQSNRYLYITGSSDANGPQSPAGVFGLFATLERPNTADLLADAQNPLVTNSTPFGPWYAAVNNSGQFSVNANYGVFSLGL